MFATMPINQLDQYIETNTQMLLIDLRPPSAYAKSHIKGAINYPYASQNLWINHLPKDRVIIFYCERGGQSMNISRYLDRLGYPVIDTIGGLSQYSGRYLQPVE